MKKNCKKIALVVLVVLTMVSLFSISAFAAGSGDVTGAVEDTWGAFCWEFRQKFGSREG